MPFRSVPNRLWIYVIYAIYLCTVYNLPDEVGFVLLMANTFGKLTRGYESRTANRNELFFFRSIIMTNFFIFRVN